MERLEARLVDRLLEIETVVEVAQEEVERPLVLAVPARRAERHVGLTRAEDEARAQGRARPLPRCQARREAFLEPEHLRARAQAEAELRDHRRALQPASARHGRDHVAPAVDHVDVHGVVGDDAPSGKVRLARPRRGEPARLARARRGGRARGDRDAADGTWQARLARAGRTRAQLEGGFSAHQAAARGVVALAEQYRHRHLAEVGVAVPGLAIGKGELGALDDGVQELRALRPHCREIEAGEEGELLEEDRALAPRAGLGHAIAVIVVAERRLVARLEARQVVRREHALVAAPGAVEHLVRAAEALDRLGDEAAIVRRARGLDLLDAIPTCSLRFLEDALVGVGKAWVLEEAAGRWRLAALEIDRGRARPGAREKLGDPRDGVAHHLRHRIAVARVVDGRLEHVAQGLRAVVAQEQHPAVEDARHHGGEEPSTRNELETERAVMRDGSTRGGRALAADHLAALALRTPKDDRHVAAEPVLVGLDHLQREGRGSRRVEGVAALLEACHGDGGGNPVRRGDDAEGALDLGPGGEHRGSGSSG